MAEPLLRVAFLNRSEDTSVTVHVKTNDKKVITYQLLPKTPASEPERGSGKDQVSEFDLEVPAGQIVGFNTNSKVEITNPNSALVTVYYANDKDPWPKPAPAAPSGLDPSDFPLRYASFLMVGGEANPAPTLVVMTLVPPGLA
jgi:hypothetical protein